VIRNTILRSGIVSSTELQFQNTSGLNPNSNPKGNVGRHPPPSPFPSPAINIGIRTFTAGDVNCGRRSSSSAAALHRTTEALPLLWAAHILKVWAEGMEVQGCTRVTASTMIQIEIVSYSK